MKRASTLSDCIPNVVLEERVTVRIRGGEESGPTGFPLIVPDAMDDTVCRNAHGVVCPFERLRRGHVLLKDTPLLYHPPIFPLFLPHASLVARRDAYATYDAWFSPRRSAIGSVSLHSPRNGSLASSSPRSRFVSAVRVSGGSCSHLCSLCLRRRLF